ncbi:peptide-methionine (S)-S-oxide reductase [Sulfitobacter sp. F26169L]|uniref:peptide-methionine (S)-S-oxide reductase n=1 Tax=Sulfitobacter sp. F26169L TaxID=2996015 RepID=UPI002260F9E2|nr:peptide-methionine (S)-S-oxide reductase [Sulfitobacter sp. F26169L]MCX7567640.1 peptide-methionine (S)-S-oxide reductase [Sulfitobacter sp. F26169L]
MSIVSIGFGGGCHWCTEAVFNALRGVQDVAQGFIKSVPPYDSFSEAVIVKFDPVEIPLAVLIESHLRTHASTSNHKMRGKYRSAVYTYSAKQAEQVQRTLERLKNSFDRPLVTQVLPYDSFKASDPRFVNYADKNAGGPFCQRYIDPKLKLLREEFRGQIKPDLSAG